MRDRVIYVAKTKALISCKVTAQLICIFVLYICNLCRFSHDAAQIRRLFGANAKLKNLVNTVFYTSIF